MEIKKLTQPKDSRLCGQTIIAMLGNVSIPEVVEAMGKEGGTTTRDMIRGLGIFGFEACSDRLVRIPKNWIKPNLCIVIIRYAGTWRSHWALWNGQEGCFYDPAYKPKIPGAYYEKVDHSRMTSYLEIKSKEKNNV